MYGWQPEWVDAAGNVGVNAGAAAGTVTRLPGTCVTGQTLAVGDRVLARPGPGAGGTRYELAPLPKAAGGLSYPVLANITSAAFYPAFGTDGSTVWVGAYTAAAQQVTDGYVLANAAPPRAFDNVLAAWPSYFAAGDTVAVFPAQGPGGDGNEAHYAVPACQYQPRVTLFAADAGDGGVGTVYGATPADEVILVNANTAAAEVSLSQPYQFNTRKRYTVKKTDPSANAVTVVGGGFGIDGASAVTLGGQYDYVTVVADGNAAGPRWHVVGRNA